MAVYIYCRKCKDVISCFKSKETIVSFALCKKCRGEDSNVFSLAEKSLQKKLSSIIKEELVRDFFPADP